MCCRKSTIGAKATIWAGLLLCLLLLSASLPAESLDLTKLSNEDLLTLYQQNSTERNALLKEQQNTLNTAQKQSLLSLQGSEEAKKLASEALMESQKAVTSANESKDLIVRTTQSYLNWQDEVDRNLKELKTQNFWLKAGMFAAMTVAASGLLMGLSR